jgi:fructose-1,6-bisphosphatase I
MNSDLAIIIEKIKSSTIEISKLLRCYIPSGCNTNEERINKSGDSVNAVDILSNEIVKKNLTNIDSIFAISSEEEDDIVYMNNNGKYLVVFDPLDGSKNIDCSLSTGSIFGIYAINNNKKINELTGHDIVYSSFALYSSATLYLDCFSKADLYILDGDYKLIKQDIQIPTKSKFYYVNESNRKRMSCDLQLLIDKLTSEGKSNRWTGCMVSDVYRLLTNGGIFFYPCDTKNTKAKLRIVYEILPMSYIVSKCGGYSYVNYKTKINALNTIIGDNIHDKSPIFLAGEHEYSL